MDPGLMLAFFFIAILVGTEIADAATSRELRNRIDYLESRIDYLYNLLGEDSEELRIAGEEDE